MKSGEKKSSANKTRDMVTTGLLICLGILLPYFTGHAFGLPGTVFLPMHIPVLLCGLLCGPGYGALCGIVVPILSSALTGMPAPYPMLPIMAGELCTYGTVGGLLYRNAKLPIWGALPLAMVAGRFVYGLIFVLLTFLSNTALKSLTVWAAVTTGLPGIVIQLILIPPLVKALEMAGNRSRKTALTEGEKMSAPQKSRSSAPDPKDLASLEEMGATIRNGEYSCMVMQNDEIVYQASGPGVRPLLGLYDTEREKFKASLAADSVVGKAAAMILYLGGAKAVYGQIMSEHAAAFLEERGIPHAWGQLVPRIENRKGDDMCPIEKSVIDLEDPEAGLAAIRSTITQLMAGKS